MFHKSSHLLLTMVLYRPVPLKEQVVSVLLQRGVHADEGSTLGPFGFVQTTTALFEAATAGTDKIVAAILAAGATPDLSSKLGPLGLLWEKAPLSAAAEHGHRVVVTALLHAGMEPP